MARNKESILEILVTLPWWFSVIFSGIVYLTLAYVAPFFLGDSFVLAALAKVLPALAPFFAVIFLIPAVISAFNSWRKGLMLESQANIESIRALNWKEFEELVAEAYRRKGFVVTENHLAGADGGVDIRIKRDGQVHLVQCKQWRTQKVGVSVIREMFGIMVDENAASVIVICSGIFTQEAKNFVSGKRIDLIDGAQLAILVGQVQSSGAINTDNPRETASACPRCGNTLALRTAKRGTKIGTKFWGCSAFPKCRHTQAYLDESI